MPYLQGPDEMDCGDSSCLFRDKSKPSGMRTNGGCRCFTDLPQSKRIFVNRIWHELQKARELLRREDICPDCGKNEASRFCECEENL